MRVIAGSAGGRRLKAPRGQHTRPTSDRVKEALFNVLAPRLPGARVLDLFAGTGALAVEAVSRGAAGAVCVEKDSAAWSALEQNVTVLGFQGRVRILRQDARRALRDLAAASERFDLILLDPPYGQGWIETVLPLLLRGELLAPGGLIVAEHRRTETPPERETAGGVQLVRARRLDYGDTSISLYDLEAPAGAQEGAGPD